MAPAKIERVISVSSEDPAYPAENLLKNAYSDKKWKSKTTGERQISVVFQLEKAEKISAIDIGNYGSAFVEILVCKSSNPDDFKPLVVTSTLMTLQEAKLGSNISGVRFFKEDNLEKEVASEKWDRIKIICLQPYNKHIQFGLSFVVFHSNSAPSSEVKPSTLGKFQLKKNDDSDGLTIGSLFAKRKENGPLELKGAAAIRAASTSGNIGQQVVPQFSNTSTSEVNQSLQAAKDSDANSTTTQDLRKRTPKTPKNEKPKTPQNKPKCLANGLGGNTPLASSNSRNSKRAADDTTENPKKKHAPKRRLEKPFNKLFEGVVFTISGFQNPYRSEIRSKALALGAKYKPDWDNTCTHLLCAFPNTPKFNQVLGHGKIITKEWIETCYNRRMRLPWRRYALHSPDKAEPESEEEIFEFVERPPSPVDNRRRLSSGEDTEEEIERVLKIQASKNQNGNNNTIEGSKIPKHNKITKNDQVTSDEEDLIVKVTNSKIDETSETTSQKEPSNRLEAEDDALFLGNASDNSAAIDDSTFSPKQEKKSKRKDLTQKFKQTGKNETLETNNYFVQRNRSDELPYVNNESPKKNERNQKIKLSKDGKANEPIIITEIAEDPYDLDTEEEDISSDSIKWDLPRLPCMFEGLKFFVADDLEEELQNKLKRYIFAHKGLLIQEDDLLFDEVHYIITESKEEVNKVKENCPSATGLRPEWVWKAHDESRIPPTKNFEL